MELSTQTLQALNTLAEHIGSFIEYWGFKKVHGKIWLHLYLSREPLDAQTLMKRLDISKALVSMSLKDLLDYDVIEIKGKSMRGTIVYGPNLDISKVITNVLRKREKTLLQLIASAHSDLEQLVFYTSSLRPTGLNGLENLNPARLKSLGKLIKNAQLGLEAMIKLQSLSFSQFFSTTEKED
jgi:DNA-binding transcriptional regulator GbsR (MarR family)